MSVSIHYNATLSCFIGWWIFLEPFYAVSRSEIEYGIKLWNHIFFSDLDKFQSLGRLKKKQLKACLFSKDLYKF